MLIFDRVGMLSALLHRHREEQSDGATHGPLEVVLRASGGGSGLLRSARNDELSHRHCEEQSDEATQKPREIILRASGGGSGLLRFARNDERSEPLASDDDLAAFPMTGAGLLDDTRRPHCRRSGCVSATFLERVP